MELLLLPASSGKSLKDIYHRAFVQSEELYIVSAYLTHWEVEEDLGSQCRSFRFIVGKDFGITRKAACEKVIGWLPKEFENDFLAAEAIQGFHPKAVFWRELDGKCYALLGSSNLSKAAFSTNHEANGYSPLSERSFAAAVKWITDLSQSCVTLDQNWLLLQRSETAKETITARS